MMYLTNPSVLDHFHSERQRRLRPTPRRGATNGNTPTHAGLRVRLGRALIGAGAALAGERVEPARPKPNPQPSAA
jgi:hypothetical protein